jgi:hypothetical protein
MKLEAFHKAIAQACGNSVLLGTVQRYWQARTGPLLERLGDYFEHPESWQTLLPRTSRSPWPLRRTTPVPNAKPCKNT